MLFENNDTLQNLQMTNTPPKMDKYDTRRRWCLTKMAHLVQCEKIPKSCLPRTTEQRDS